MRTKDIYFYRVLGLTLNLYSKFHLCFRTIEVKATVLAYTSVLKLIHEYKYCKTLIFGRYFNLALLAVKNKNHQKIRLLNEGFFVD